MKKGLLFGILLLIGGGGLAVLVKFGGKPESLTEIRGKCGSSLMEKKMPKRFLQIGHCIGAVKKKKIPPIKTNPIIFCADN